MELRRPWAVSLGRGACLLSWGFRGYLEETAEEETAVVEAAVAASAEVASAVVEAAMAASAAVVTAEAGRDVEGWEAMMVAAVALVAC